MSVFRPSWQNLSQGPPRGERASPPKDGLSWWEKQKRRRIFSPRRVLLGGVILGAVGVGCLAIWVDWTQWAISRWQRQLPNLPAHEAVELLHQVGPWEPASIPLLVQGLCDPRQEVAQAAEEELQNLQHQWENQAWHHVAKSFVLLAETLLERKEDLPPHSVDYARNRVQWMLTWRPPQGSAQRVQMLSACEKLIEYLDQAGSPSHQKAPAVSKTSSPKKTVSQEPLTELIDPLQGFELAGGALPVELVPKDSLLETASSPQMSSQVPDDKVQAQADTLRLSGANQSVRISDPGQQTPSSTLQSNSSGVEESKNGDRTTLRANAPLRIGESDGAGAFRSEASLENSPPAKIPGSSADSASANSGNDGTHDRAGAGHGDMASPGVLTRREDLSQKGTRELLELLAAASSEDQAVLQTELAQRGFGVVSREFARRLCDPNPQVRLELVRCLPGLPGVETVAWLFWLCEDPDVQVRGTAIALLATTHDPAVLRQLELILSRTPDESLRRQTERVRSLRQELLR